MDFKARKVSLSKTIQKYQSEHLNFAPWVDVFSVMAALYSVYCILYSVYCILYSVHCTVCIVTLTIYIIFIKRVTIKSLQCHLKLKNEKGTPKPCKLLKGAAHGKMS